MMSDVIEIEKKNNQNTSFEEIIWEASKFNHVLFIKNKNSDFVLHKKSVD